MLRKIDHAQHDWCATRLMLQELDAHVDSQASMRSSGISTSYHTAYECALLKYMKVVMPE
jgi:hypothetical protein